MVDLNINNMKYIAINDFEHDLEVFDSLSQARKWLERSFNNEEDSYKPEEYDLRIYKLYETLEITESEDPETPDEWTYEFLSVESFVNDTIFNAIVDFKMYLNSIVNNIPNEIHEELWYKFNNLISAHYKKT